MYTAERDTDIENTPTDTRGLGEGGRQGELGTRVAIYTLLIV